LTPIESILSLSSIYNRRAEETARLSGFLKRPARGGRESTCQKSRKERDQVSPSRRAVERCSTAAGSAWEILLHHWTSRGAHCLATLPILKSGQKKGKPGLPGASEHPTLYQGTCELILEEAQVADRFVRLKVYDGKTWRWANYPVRCSRYFQQRQRDPAWEQHSPLLVLTEQTAALHFLQTKQVQAKKVKESKRDPDLVTVAVDLNVKNLANC
jgi:hypothetical protein